MIRSGRLLPAAPGRFQLTALDPNLAYVFAGGGFAVDIRHCALTFLYHPAGSSVGNSDLAALTPVAVAILVSCQPWIQVQTPSVADWCSSSDDNADSIFSR